MNRKNFFVPMVVFLMLLTVAPVLAFPTHWQKAPAWNTTTGVVSSAPPVYSWTTKDGITIEIGVQSDVTGQLGIGTTTYALYSHSVFNLVYDSKTSMADRYSDATWYVTAMTTGPLKGASDGFSGVVIILYNGATSLNPANGSPVGTTSYSVQLKLQGFGEFKGQTLMISYDGPAVKTAKWTGYCLIPT